MILLFEENEKLFNSLGLGVLKDAISCKVKEGLNDQFAVELEYPVNGLNFSKIQNDRIIYCKPTPYDYAQPFRINSITKPIKGVVKIYASHISYDMNDIPVLPFDAKNLNDALNKIMNGVLQEDGTYKKISVVDNDFKFVTDSTSAKTFKTTAPFNLRALLMGGDESLMSVYDVELKFDKMEVQLLQKRGKDRGAIVKYGHNMTDINHEASTELLYNGVFPYYHTEKTSTETSNTEGFTQVYIVGSTPYQQDWLSFTENGEPYHPVDSSPVQIATEGDFYQKVYVWNETTEIFEEKIYNQSINLIQGVLEPSWLTIDWSKFPLIICKAARRGYFKTATDSDWGDLKGVGDVVFEESIISSGIASNIMMYFSEVIPTDKDSKNEEVNEIVDVQLDNPIIWLETNDAKNMKHNKVLMLDLTSEFDDEPSKEALLAKAEEQIQKLKIGTIKHTTTVSFVDLSATTEASRYENFDHIELGDTVSIIYEDANISIKLRVIALEYDAIADRYLSVELGEKKDTMSSSSVQTGDNISSLSNDAGYTTVTQVNKLIANIVTANYIEALNARLTKAQISQLEVERINVKGVLEASQFTLDSLIAKLLIAENAEIANTLTAGNIKVAGDITINSGSISISSKDGLTSFYVDRDGNVTSNSVTITGGTLDIGNGNFTVSNGGLMTANNAVVNGTIVSRNATITGGSIQIKGDFDTFFEVDEKGNVRANSITMNGGELLLGDIEYTQVTVTETEYKQNKYYLKVSSNPDVYRLDDDITWSSTKTYYQSSANFKVDNEGNVLAYSMNIRGGSLSIGELDSTNNESVIQIDEHGTMFANNTVVKGYIKAETLEADVGHIAGFDLIPSVISSYQLDTTVTYLNWMPFTYYRKVSTNPDVYELDNHPEFQVGVEYYKATYSSLAYFKYGIPGSSNSVLISPSKSVTFIHEDPIYRKIKLTSATYLPDVYYILNIDDEYVLSTDPEFDEDETYYERVRYENVPNVAFAAGPDFYVTNDGYLRANNIEIIGGKIGGVNISQHDLEVENYFDTDGILFGLYDRYLSKRIGRRVYYSYSYNSYIASALVGNFTIVGNSFNITYGNQAWVMSPVLKLLPGGLSIGGIRDDVGPQHQYTDYTFSAGFIPFKELGLLLSLVISDDDYANSKYRFDTGHPRIAVGTVENVGRSNKKVETGLTNIIVAVVSHNKSYSDTSGNAMCYWEGGDLYVSSATNANQTVAWIAIGY